MSAFQELSALKTHSFDAGLVFSGTASGTLIQGFEQASSYTPKTDPNYVFHDSSRDIIVWFLTQSEPLYIYGYQGCGKSSCIKQLAARLNYPVFEITGHGRLEFADLIGHLTMENGNMTFQYGPLALAMRYGGICLINEIDLTSPEIAAGLNGILDGSPLCIAENGGELIEPHPMFRFAATANTNGAGDETGLFQGTQRQNAAFLDRFILCKMEYPDAEVEKKLLQKRYPNMPTKVLTKMVDFANEVRRLFMGDTTMANYTNSIEVTFSTRSLLRWAELTERFQPLSRQGIQPLSYALDRALGYRACSETRAMLHELVQRFFPVAEVVQGENYTRTDYAVNFTKPYKVSLEKIHDIGTGKGKFWKLDAQNDGITIYWGKLGTVGQNLFIPKADCKGENPLEEGNIRIQKKIREGYSFADNTI